MGPCTRPRLFVFFLISGGLILSGPFYGWAPVQLLLIKDKQYGELCPVDQPPEVEDCGAQLKRLGLLYTVFTVCGSALSIPMGMLVDTFGARLGVALAGAAQVLGWLGMAFSNTRSFDIMVPSMMLEGFGSMSFMIGAFSASAMYPRFQTLIITALNVLFDASAVLPTVLYQSYVSFGVSRQVLFTGMAAVVAFVWLGVLLTWPPSSPHAADGASTLDSDSGDLMHARPIRSQLHSLDFLVILLFAVAGVTHSTIYLGTVRDWLEYLGDASTGFLYSTILSWCLPISILVIPLVPYSLKRIGYAGMLSLINIAGAVFAVMSAVPLLPQQLGAFLLFTVYRAFLYSVQSSFIAQTFGLRSMGRINGIVYLVLAACFALQYPVVWLSQTRLRGSYQWFHVACLLAHIGLFPLLEYYRRRSKAESALARDESVAPVILLEVTGPETPPTHVHGD